MGRKIGTKIGTAVVLILVAALINFPSAASQKKVLTFLDIMKFREVNSPVISEDGAWVAYNAQPDRGDGEVRVHGLEAGKAYAVERGEKPVISKNSRWVVMAVKPPAVELEKKDKKKPKQGMALLETLNGNVSHFENVDRFSLSDDSGWLAYLHFKEEEKKEQKDSEKTAEKTEAAEKKEAEAKKREIGSTLVVRRLDSGKETQISFVLAFAFDSSSQYLAYTVSSPEGKENGVYYADLKEEGLPQKAMATKEKGEFTSLTWMKKGLSLAFVSSSSVWIWEGKKKELIKAVQPDAVPDAWLIPSKNELSWSEDGKRLFFGLKPKYLEEEAEEKTEEKEAETDLFDVEKILEKREVDVWHWNDPFIITHQKKQWPRLKDRTYLAVYHLESGRTFQLADEEMPVVQLNENPNLALGLSDVPYRKEVTWDGVFHDVHLVDLRKAERLKLLQRLAERPSLSPEGGYILFYHEKHWYLLETASGKVKNLTEKLDVPFFNEDHDLPGRPPSYGIAGWIEGDKAVLVYDKYDIWKFTTKTGKPENLTQGKGRENKITFRLVRLDPEQKYFKENEELLLSSFHNLKKNFGFYFSNAGKPGVNYLLEEEKRFRFLAKAKKANALLYTRESFEEFPDIWVSDMRFSSPKKVSEVNPQVKDFIWGKAELVKWTTQDGIPLQGVLIKPENYEQGKRYPVIVYFYELFSQRLYEFNQTVVNHRPCFPLYASNGYCIFLPDIRFEVGRPGVSATKCLVSGVQKLIDLGVADPEAVGLHGHSWSGYQTAFVITQTDMFAAAIAGAPVSNMTSAYSGIRWESGLARQFQYEKSQSRIGGNLWDYPELYMENSPVFYADLVHTPLLIMFGDEDGAVPWYQGIELYLALRRLEKDCIFLQYREEPHHLQKYPNKLDYSIRMKEYFDCYLKKMPGPDWIKVGVRYRGK